MRYLLTLLLIFLNLFLNIHTQTVLFKELGKISYEGLVEQANNNDINALKELKEAWQNNNCPNCPYAKKFAFIGDYLTKQGYSSQQIETKLTSIQVTPEIPTPSESIPIAPAIPSAPTAPPMPPSTPSVSSDPLLSPGAVANLTDNKRKNLIQQIESLLQETQPGSTNESNLKDYLKKIKLKIIKNREMTSLEGLFREINSEKDKENELKKQEQQIKEQFEKESTQVEANLKQLVKNRIANQNIKDKLDTNFAGSINGKAIIKTAEIIMFLDEAQQAIESIKIRLANIDKEPNVINIAKDISIKSNNLSFNKTEISKLQASLTELNEEAILQAVAKIKKLTLENNIFIGALEALKKEKDPIVKLIKLNFDNQIKILEKIIENKTAQLREVSISKEEGRKLLSILNIKEDPNSPLVRIIAAKRGSVITTKPGIMPTAAELARMAMAGASGAINRPTAPASPAISISPVDSKLTELFKLIQAFDNKSYSKDNDRQKALKYYNDIKDNAYKLTEEQRKDLIKGLEKDLNIINTSDQKYRQQIARSQTDKLDSIFINFEEAKDFL